MLSSIPSTTLPVTGLTSIPQPSAPTVLPVANNPATMPNRSNASNQASQAPKDPFSGFDDLWKSSKTTKTENTAKPSMASLAQQKTSASLWNAPSGTSKPQASQNNSNNDDLLL